MRRILLFLAALFAAAWWFGRARRANRTEPPRQPGDALAADPMVRDRVCNTFLPRSKALVSGSGDKQLFFCSPACQNQYLEAKKSP